MDMVDKNNEDMQLHREEVTEMMSLAAWCLQGNFNKRPSMSSVFKVLEGLVSVETNLDFNFTYLTEVGAGNQQREATISPILPSVLSGPCQKSSAKLVWLGNCKVLVRFILLVFSGNISRGKGGILYNSVIPRAIWNVSLTRQPSTQPKFAAKVGVSDSLLRHRAVVNVQK
ncbi:hypothetical protein BC332_19481 [Capsicum chinense]|nr:hypothetical protein BC332_19481 [Capsicum chinense]